MKPTQLAGSFIALVFLSIAEARDLKTLNGEVFKSITVVKKDATGLQIGHDEGVIFIDFRSLSAAEQKEFGYDRAAYAAAWKEKNEIEKVRRQQAQAAQAAAAARARAQASASPTPAARDFAPRTRTPAVQSGLEVTIDAPGFRYGPYDYDGRGFSNTIPPSQGGTLVPYPYNPYGPFPNYNGATWGPTIIRRR